MNHTSYTVHPTKEQGTLTENVQRTEDTGHIHSTEDAGQRTLRGHVQRTEATGNRKSTEST